MQTVLNVTVPIFSLMAIGYLAALLRLLPEKTDDALSSFVFVIGVPMLLFRTLGTADFGGANPLFLWLAYFSGLTITWALGTLLLRLRPGIDRRRGVIAGISASFANTVFVAIPAVQRAYGEEGLEALFLIISVHLPTMMIAATLLMERAALRDARDAGMEMPAVSTLQTVGRIVSRLARNGIVVGILCGFLWRMTGLALPATIDEAARLLGSTAGPLSLFALGMSLTRYGIRGDVTDALILAALSLILMPAIVYAIGIALLPSVWLKAAVLTAASPTGINAYLLAVHFRSGEKLAATMILASTVFSIASLSAWLLFLG